MLHVSSLTLICIGLAFLLRDQASYSGFQTNDMSVHEAMAMLALQKWHNAESVLETWFEATNLGYPVFRTYQNWPTLISAAISLPTGTDSVPSRMNQILVLALSTQPLAAFVATRWAGFGKNAAWVSALFCLLAVSRPGLGNEWSSYLTAGYGLYPQALASPWFLLTIGAGIRASGFSGHSGWTARANGLLVGSLWAVTFLMHHLYGFMALLCLGVIVLTASGTQKQKPNQAIPWILSAALVAALITAYQGWSIFHDLPLIHTPYWEPIADGLSVTEVSRGILLGQVFDNGRWPVMSGLVLIGTVTALFHRRWDLVALTALCGLGLLGRQAGGWLNHIPGLYYLHMDRFMGPLHLCGLLLIAMAATAWAGHPHRWVRAMGLTVFTAAALYCFFHTLPFIEMNKKKLRMNRQFASVLPPHLFRSIESDRLLGRLWTGSESTRSAVVDPMALGWIPYYLMAQRFGFAQTTFGFHRIGLASELMYYIDPLYLKDFERMGVRTVFLPPKHPFVSASRERFRGPGINVQVLDDVGYFSVACICEVRTLTPPIRMELVRWWKTDRHQNCTEVPIPQPIARAWLLAVPQPSTQCSQAQWVSGGRQNNRFNALFHAQGSQSWGVFKYAYHPRWQIRVNNQPRPPRWFPPGFVAFELVDGKNQVEIEFAPDPIRRFLFWLSLVTLITVLCVLGCPAVRRRLT